MTWNYTGAPSTSTATGRRDAVRLLIGDTDINDQQISNEEIAFALSEKNDEIYSSSALCCRMIAGKYARQVDISIDGVSHSASQRKDHYTSLAIRLEEQSSTSGGGLGTPYVGGVSISERDSVNDDSDRIKPAFERGRFDNPQDSSFDEILDD